MEDKINFDTLNNLVASLKVKEKNLNEVLETKTYRVVAPTFFELFFTADKENIHNNADFSRSYSNVKILDIKWSNDISKRDNEKFILDRIKKDNFLVFMCDDEYDSSLDLNLHFGLTNNYYKVENWPEEVIVG